MSQWQPQPQFRPHLQQQAGWQPRRPMEVRGTGKAVTWDGRTLVIRAFLGGEAVTIPARQVSGIRVSPIELAFTVTTTGGRSVKVSYWPGRGKYFRALRDAVMDAVAAMG